VSALTGAGAAARVGVKICGVCRAADARLALAADADYIGVIVHGPGPRVLGAARAAGVLDPVPTAARVGVFVDLDAAAVLDAASTLRLGVIQLHGEELPAEVARIHALATARVWKAVRPRDARDFAAAVASYRGIADALLVDAGTAGMPGGSGARFDWSVVAAHRAELGALPLIVAGGLNPANVAEAVRRLAPSIVDVSSGVEEAIGRKSAAKVRDFVARARQAHDTRPDVTGRT
jgi:phosphoribosylanthranilate isomerase